MNFYLMSDQVHSKKELESRNVSIVPKLTSKHKVGEMFNYTDHGS